MVLWTARILRAHGSLVSDFEHRGLSRIAKGASVERTAEDFQAAYL